MCETDKFAGIQHRSGIREAMYVLYCISMKFYFITKMSALRGHQFINNNYFPLDLSFGTIS